MKRWSWLLVPMVAGCGVTVYDKGSDIYTTGGISLVYADWVAPKESNWQKDSYECDAEAREAILTGLVLPFAAEAQPTPLPGTREPVEATIIEVVSTTRQLLQGEVSVTMCALELPRRETSGVEMVFVRFGGF